MQESILGAITSPELRKELYKATRQVNPVAGLLFIHIIRTGMYLKNALNTTVDEMTSYIASDKCLLTDEEKILFKKHCDSLAPNEYFYTYEGKTLTRSAVSVIWDKVSEIRPPYLITSIALRKTYFWDMYINSPKKKSVMRKLQVYSLEELAEYFEVPLSAVTDTASTKTTVFQCKEDILGVLSDTEEIIQDIKDTMNNSLLPDKDFDKILKYINTIDLANSLYR